MYAEPRSRNSHGTRRQTGPNTQEADCKKQPASRQTSSASGSRDFRRRSPSLGGDLRVVDHCASIASVRSVFQSSRGREVVRLVVIRVLVSHSNDSSGIRDIVNRHFDIGADARLKVLRDTDDAGNRSLIGQRRAVMQHDKPTFGQERALHGDGIGRREDARCGFDGVIFDGLVGEVDRGDRGNEDAVDLMSDAVRGRDISLRDSRAVVGCDATACDLKLHLGGRAGGLARKKRGDGGAVRDVARRKLSVNRVIREEVEEHAGAGRLVIVHRIGRNCGEPTERRVVGCEQRERERLVINDESLTLTLLAPDNAAFGGLATVPTNAVDDDEPASSSMLFDFLAYHAIDGEFASGDITNGASVPTLLPGETAGSSSEVEFQVTSSGITANDGPAVTQADIPATNGVAHKINGVLIPPIASVDFTDQPVEDDSVETTPGVFAPADSVTVQGAFLPEGGFVVLHDSTALADQGAIPSIVGVSEYLEPGISTDIKVPIDNVSNTATIVAMAHEDSNDNESYDFSTSGGLEDGPYTRDGGAVIDNAEVSPE